MFEDMSCERSMVQQVGWIVAWPQLWPPRAATFAHTYSFDASQATSTSTRVPFAERQQNSTSTTSQAPAKRASGKHGALTPKQVAF